MGDESIVAPVEGAPTPVADAGTLETIAEDIVENQEEHVITADDLAMNPDLVEAGVQEGDVIGFPAEVSDEEAADIVAGLVQEEPQAPTKSVPVEEVEVIEKAIPSIVGREIAGKKIQSARWNADRLVVKDENGVEFTLSGAELEAFLGE